MRCSASASASSPVKRVAAGGGMLIAAPSGSGRPTRVQRQCQSTLADRVLCAITIIAFSRSPARTPATSLVSPKVSPSPSAAPCLSPSNLLFVIHTAAVFACAELHSRLRTALAQHPPWESVCRPHHPWPWACHEPLPLTRLFPQGDMV